MDWETPDWLFNSLNKEFKFNLDAAATKYNKKCKKYYSPNKNTLTKTWIGNVWLNPPYGREIKLFLRKAYHQSKKQAKVVVCLVPVRADTIWWHKYAMKASEIRLLNKRIEFKYSTNKAPFPVCLVIFRHGFKGNPVLTTLDVTRFKIEGSKIQ
jgi:site-specific DNA-methyltransferase (adenine-specific)